MDKLITPQRTQKVVLPPLGNWPEVMIDYSDMHMLEIMKPLYLSTLALMGRKGYFSLNNENSELRYLGVRLKGIDHKLWMLYFSIPFNHETNSPKHVANAVSKAFGELCSNIVITNSKITLEFYLLIENLSDVSSVNKSIERMIGYLETGK